jgi:hypothetical protein
MRGVSLSLGSHIVYPVRRGSTMWLVEAVIESIHPQEGENKAYLYVQVLREKGKHVDEPRWTRVLNLNNVAVVGNT